MDEDQDTVKFRVKADLALFEALQRDGKLTEEGISKVCNIPPTTVHYALDRIRKRGFFWIKAVPNLARFPDVPMAIIGFSNVHPVRIREVCDKSYGVAEVVWLFHSERDVVICIMDVSSDSLTQRLYGVMELLGEKPCIYMTSPTVAKFDVTIPDKVLESVYGDLADRSIKV